MSDTTNDTTRDDFLAKLDGFGEAVRSMREEAAACCGIFRSLTGGDLEKRMKLTPDYCGRVADRLDALLRDLDKAGADLDKARAEWEAEGPAEG